MDYEAPIQMGDGGRSEDKRQQIWEVGVGQRRRGAMLSVQSKAMDQRVVFRRSPPDVLTGWQTQLFLH
jgi:hypothetical protein